MPHRRVAQLRQALHDSQQDVEEMRGLLGHTLQRLQVW